MSGGLPYLLLGSRPERRLPWRLWAAAQVPFAVEFAPSAATTVTFTTIPRISPRRRARIAVGTRR